MITKAQLIESIEELPEQFQLDQVMDKLLFIHNVSLGLEDSLNGKVNNLEQTKQKLNKWVK